MRVVFTGAVHVEYGQIYVESGGEAPTDPLPAAFAGQVNGLCGAAWPGFLFLITGLHTGHVGFTAEIHDAEPPIDDSWDDIVEVSFRPASESVALVEWGGPAVAVVDVEDGDYRVRYSASGSDRAREADTRRAGEPELDRYLLQFWPARPAPDQVVKQTSAHAAYWHDAVRKIPPPPTAEERARIEREAERERREQARRFEDEWNWGGTRPSERLRNVGGNVYGLVKLDRALVDAVADADPDVQRQVARWAARQACDAAGISSLEWLAPALDAIEQGEQLPPPFDDRAQVWRLLFGEGVQFRTVLSRPGDEPVRVSREAAAVPSLWAAVEPDPLRAALDALFAAAVTFGDEYPRLLRQVRLAFPAVR